MKLTRTFWTQLAVAAAFGMAFLGSSAEAQTVQANLNVSATVSDDCVVTTTPVNFGTYNTVTAAAVVATGTVSVTCAVGVNATARLGQGANAGGGSTDAAPVRRMADGSGNFLNYQLFSDAGRTTVWGNTAGTGVGSAGTGAADILTVYGEIAAGQGAAPVGAYADVVVASVDF